MSLPLANIMRLTAGPEQLRPCLYGPTGSGKTARVEQAAKELGMPVVRLLLQSMLAEDVLGLPRVIRGRTVWSIPDWAAQLSTQPGILFLDEMDKPRPDVLAAVLTLMWELRLRDLQLHPDTIVVAGMQPVDAEAWRADETLRAVAARMVFIPVGYREGYEWVAQTLNSPWAKELANKLDGKPPELPVTHEISPRQLAQAIMLARSGFPVDLLARGIVSSPACEWLAARLEEELQGANDAHVDPVSIARTLPLEQLFEAGLAWAEHGPADAWAEALVRIWTEGDEDLARRFLQAQYERLARSLQLCGDDPPDVVVRAFERACERIAEAWTSRAGGAK